MKSPILNIERVAFYDQAHGDRFACRIAPVGRKLESRSLGFNVTVVPPGKRAFPYHAHRAIEEMFFILEGRGSIRIAGETHPIRQGDFISLPPGRGSAHQIVNDSDAPLRYLAVSTMQSPDVVEYPDSGKIGVMADWEAGGRPASPDAIHHFARVRDGVDYWEGE